MWWVPDEVRTALTGDVQVGVTASALYDGRVTVADLPVVSCQYHALYDGQAVRTGVRLEVATPDGALWPILPTDPLAPYGQRVSVRATISYGQVELASIPMGVFRLQAPDGPMRWVPYRTEHGRTWLPGGGTVTVEADDLQLSLIKAEIVGVMQPRGGATVASEVRRLCAGLMDVDTTGLPTVAVPKRGVYELDRHQTIRELLTLVGRVPAPSRSGVLVPLAPVRASTPHLVVDPDSMRLVDAQVRPSDDGLVNVVEATNELADAADGSPVLVRGVARETSGPYRWDGPLGPIRFGHASPLYLTNSAAAAGAATIMARKRAARELTVRAKVRYDPTVDVLDTHRVWLAPGLSVLALVVGVEADLSRGETMAITYTVPRAEVESWIRPSFA